MLRLGLVSSRRLALATSLRSSTTLLGTTNCARYLSTTEEQEKQEQQEQHQKKQTPKLRRPETSKSNDDGTDALHQFFQRRRAALQKEEQARQQQQQQNPSRVRPNGNQGKHNTSSFQQEQQQQQQQQPRYNQRQNQNRFSSRMQQQNNSNTGQSQKQSRQTENSSQQRRNANNNQRWRQGERFQQRQGNNSSQRQQHGDHFQRRQGDNSFQRRPNRPQQQQQQQQRGSTEQNAGRQNTSRLTELMQQLRRKSPVESSSSKGPSRDRPFQQNSRQQFRKSGQERTWNRPFLKQDESQEGPQRNHSRREERFTQNQGNQKWDSDFLQGRVTRSDDETDKDSAGEEIEASRMITLPSQTVTVVEASAMLRIKIDDIRKTLRAIGAGGVENLDIDTMELLAMEHGFETERSTEEVTVDNEQLLMKQRRVEEIEYPPRPPVVCIMGHVDHGKTTLMDALRRRAAGQEVKTKKKKAKKSKAKSKKGGAAGSKDVAGTEAGGITQIISAFQVAVEGYDESKVTFLDTPGHAAFKAMRQSGSHAADVIALVVAADDGVSEQTIEIIDFYKSIVKGSHDGGISMVVALNKIDKPGVDVEEAKMRIENQLLEHGIFSEGMTGESTSEYGPPVQIIPTSGLTGLGLDDFMEGLVLQSEVMDLRADDQANAEGIVMDATLEKGLGVVVDCIIRWGNIKRGDVVVSGTQIAKVKILKDVNDKVLKQGMPSQPVRITGFKSLPKAGDPIMCVESEDAAEELVKRKLAMEAGNKDRPDAANTDVEIHISGMRSRDTARAKRVHEQAGLAECDGTIRIPIIVKADADGSLSAVRDSLVSLGQSCEENKVVIDPVLEGIGDITANDIQMAKESNATIFAFGLKRIDQNILNIAESEDVTIRTNDIIYSLLDDAKVVLGKHLPLIPTEDVHGRATVQALFDINDGNETIAGLKVTEGQIYKDKATIDSKTIDCQFRVLRDGELVSAENGQTASSLRHFKELVDSVEHGNECGLGLSGFNDFKNGDVVECYSVKMVEPSL